MQLAGKLPARLKVMSRLDIAERRVPQDGRIKMQALEDPGDRLPRQHLPDALRREDRDAYSRSLQAQLGIDALGYEGFQKELYLKSLAKPQGMILVTGPTGSGKTVSLYTGLNILNREDTNISTAEDPSEINLPGVNQVNVNPKVGLTFASAMRAFLRQDPDVIMVGEIRDLETAEIAIKAAQTGHLVLSTLHTNDAPQTLTPARRHGRQALCHRDLGQPDHRAAPGAAAVHELQAVRGSTQGGAAQRGFHAKRTSTRACRSSARKAATNAPTATRAASASTRSCP